MVRNESTEIKVDQVKDLDFMQRGVSFELQVVTNAVFRGLETNQNPPKGYWLNMF